MTARVTKTSSHLRHGRVLLVGGWVGAAIRENQSAKVTWAGGWRQRDSWALQAVKQQPPLSSWRGMTQNPFPLGRQKRRCLMVGRNNCSSLAECMCTHTRTTQSGAFSQLSRTLWRTPSLSLSFSDARTTGGRRTDRGGASGAARALGSISGSTAFAKCAAARQAPKRSFASSSFSPARARPAHAATLSGTHPVTPDPEPWVTSRWWVHLYICVNVSAPCSCFGTCLGLRFATRRMLKKTLCPSLFTARVWNKISSTVGLVLFVHSHLHFSAWIRRIFLIWDLQFIYNTYELFLI